MRRLKRLTAMLLCLATLVPAQPTGATTIPAQETLIVDEGWREEQVTEPEREQGDSFSDQPEVSIKEKEPASNSHYQETISLDPILDEDQAEWDGDLVIYWNPEGDPALWEKQLASPSEGSRSNGAAVPQGSDHADGLTPQSAVRSLNTAIRRAEKLSRQQSVEMSDITIKAMRPMVLSQGTMYTVRGRGVHLTSWEEREDDSEVIFAVDGGQLTLHNLILEPQDGGTAAEDAELVYLKAGTLQMGERVESYGSFVLDYAQEYDSIAWSSHSQADASGSEANQYREPVVELLKKFEPASDYVLDLRVPLTRTSVTAVAALYSDDQSTDEFMDSFVIVDSEADGWNLSVEERIGGVLRDTTEESEDVATVSETTPSEVQAMSAGLARNQDIVLTQKSLVASRAAGVGKTVYWNPGAEIKIYNPDGSISEVFPGGDDIWHDGTRPTAAVRSWYKARKLAQGGTIICMQSIDMSKDVSYEMAFGFTATDDASYYNGPQYQNADGDYVLDGELDAAVTIAPWELKPSPVLLIPDGVSVVLKNIILQGQVSEGGSGLIIKTQMLLCAGGQLKLEKNVVTDEAYIQIDLLESNQAKDHPIIVNSADVQAGVYFGGINQNIAWRYQDVIIAGTQLVAAAGGTEAAGDVLLENIVLQPANYVTIEEGGASRFKWLLRKDTIEDDGVANPSRIELYTTYYFDAIYVDGIRGSDTYYGASCEYPVKSFPKVKQILLAEMDKSLAARQAAYDSGQDWTKYPIPDTIYICGTVTVEDLQVWEFPNYTDVDGSVINIEILAHQEPAQNEGGTFHLHTVPEILIQASGATANLTLGNGILIRSTVDLEDTEIYTVVVQQGATLNLQGNAVLTGLPNSAVTDQRTRGTHILVGKAPGSNTVNQGNLHMKSDWTGILEGKNVGIRAFGSNSQLTMQGGEIRNHYNKADDYYAGVYLSQATFKMDGGKIHSNYSKLGGTGVYVDTGAIFEMKSGVIEKNTAYTIAGTTADDVVTAFGVGVYVASGASFTMGESQSGDNSLCRISDQFVDNIYKGVGLYIASGASFEMYSGTISGNKGRGSKVYANHLSYGGGIANYGSLTIHDGLITDNGNSFTGNYSSLLGGGLYLEGTSQSILGGVISHNQTGSYYSSASYTNTGGGGLYLKKSAVIKNVTIENNRSYYGAGIVTYFNNTTELLQLENCTIQNNLSTIQNAAQYPDATAAISGYGAGIYAAYSRITAVDVQILNNKSGSSGGGMYLSGGTSANYTIKFSDSLIKDNVVTAGNGGGIYSYNYLILSQVTIEGNQATSSGGGLFVYGPLFTYDVKILDNKAVSGGGLYVTSYAATLYSTLIQGNQGTNGGGIMMASGYVYGTNVHITENIATAKGGGVYMSAGQIHLSERPGDGDATYTPMLLDAELTANQAIQGGGIYVAAGIVYLDIEQAVVNHTSGAEAQGNNIFLSQSGTNMGTLYVLKGEFLQPDDTLPGVYNIWMDSIGSTDAKLYLDPDSMTVGGPDALYMNTTNNYLVYLKAPTGTNTSLPVSINPAVFSTGSIVVRPANLTSLTMYQAQMASQGQLNKNYLYSPAVRDAATTDGLTYVQGGSLPARMTLGGYVDANSSLLTNIVLIGQGVYLDGVNGNDSRDGTSPGLAVKTLEKAEELLRLYVTNDTSTEGFSPFIYICGTVTVSQSAQWELDYTEALFREQSKYYQVELAAGREPEPAQIKRFASFLKSPMVQVTGASTTLTIPQLIIDGQADAVITSIQGASSPILRVTDATVILKDRASLRNNYYNMIVQSGGKIRLESQTPDSDSFINEQLRLTWGDGVQVSNGGVVEMTGYATMRYTSVPPLGKSISYYYNAGQIGRGVVLNTASQLIMKDDSKITFTDLSVLPSASYVFGAVIGDLANTAQSSVITMQDRAEISNCYAAFGLYAYNSELQLKGDSKLKDNYYGTYTYGYYNKFMETTIILDDNAKIYSSGERGAASYNGIYLSGTDSSSVQTPTTDQMNIVLKGHSEIYNMANQGIRTNYIISELSIQLEEDAQIYNTGSYGIYQYYQYAPSSLSLSGSAAIYDQKQAGIYQGNMLNEVSVELKDQAKIYNNVLYGISQQLNNTSSEISLSDDAKIYGHTSTSSYTAGIYLQGTNGVSTVRLADDSMITDNTVAGISMSSGMTANIIMTGNSSLQRARHGIYNVATDTKLTIDMTDNSFMCDNTTAGIWINSPITALVMSMSGNSWIGSSATGAGSYGVYLSGTGSSGYKMDRTDAYQITMSDQALIGGIGAHNSSLAKRGLTYGGIVVRVPVKITMKDDSQISYNNQYGISLERYTTTYEYSYGQTTIVVDDRAALNESNLGINSVDKVLTNGEPYITEQITIGGSAQVTARTYAFQILGDSTVVLKDQAHVTSPSTLATSYSTILTNGFLSMDGTVQVDGIIALKNGKRPITLTKPVPAGAALGQYQLYLAESFVGEIVVQPDGTGVTDASLYEAYFSKVKGDGMAGEKPLVALEPNIVLLGENNVFLSVNGNDANNGVAPTSAVRTFKRAKEILETGYFTSGANIQICAFNTSGVLQNSGYPLIVLAGDENWSFDTDGYFTNPASGDRWQPLVTRHETYYGNMIAINGTTAGMATAVTFENIIVDGLGGQSVPVGIRRYDKQILRINNGEATLGSGAIFQNNQLDSNNNYIVPSTSSTYASYANMGVYVAATGKFVLDGGTIQGMKLLNVQNYTYRIDMGSTIYNVGTVEIKDGLIQNNELGVYGLSSYANGTSIHAMILNTGTATFTMNGGTIRNNRIDTGIYKYIYGGAVSFSGTSTGALKGGLISGNEGGRGAALYHGSVGVVEVEGGRIYGNSSAYHTSSINDGSPIYISAPLFQIKGGGGVLDDPIYLDSTEHIISVSGSIYQASRRYHVYLNLGSGTNQFKKGSVVVQPYNNMLLDASQFLINFDVRTKEYVLDQGQSATNAGGTIAGVKEKQCLLLMQSVFLDSVKGDDSNDGSTPKKAVASFDKAKDRGEGTNKTASNKDYYIIYISGLAKPKTGEVWELNNTAYMCRYTGFQLYQADGTLATTELPYSEYLIEPQGELTLKNIKIYGRRVIDGSSANGDSILRVKAAELVTMMDGTLLSRNDNVGTYISHETGLQTSLSGKGGAVKVEKNGSLKIEGGTISNTDAAFGTAIYQDADVEVGGTSFGKLQLSNSPSISGNIFLNGQIDRAEAYITVTENYVPASGKIQIRIANDYSGRPIVYYLNNAVPTIEQLEYYVLDDSVQAVYDFVSRVGDPSMLELQLRHLIYLDGQNGNDANDGSNPAQALQSLRGVYQRVKASGASAGTLVYVVGTVDIDGSITLINEKYQQGGLTSYKGRYLNNQSAEEIEIESQLYFKRYSQPDSTTASGYQITTHKGSLFLVEPNGVLEMNGMYLDGHAQKSVSSFDYLQAPGVESNAPLVTVAAGGYLKAGYIQMKTMTDGSGGQYVRLSTNTLFSNNTNTMLKTKILGQNAEGQNVIEGSGAGIEILSDAVSKGKVELKQVEFKSLALNADSNGGTDVYNNGELIAQEETIFSGTIFLEGLGSAGSPASSRYITAGAYGTPFKNNFNILIRDPYNTRTVVMYPSGRPTGPPDSDIGYFLLEERVNRYYALGKRASEQYVLELTIPQAVYLDGQNGNDTTNSGYAPIVPVKTLKKAYERLKESNGKVIYVMGTVTVDQSIELSATDYVSGGQSVTLFVSTDHVDLRRFVKPRAGESGSQYNSDYNVPDFTGTLFEVENGAILTVKTGVNIDGHYTERVDIHDPVEFYVDHTTESKAPLIHVKSGGTLKLMEGSKLENNHNTKTLVGTESRIPGGALFNSGTVEFNSSAITGNAAPKGAGIYQDGTFELVSGVDGLANQEIYLTTVNDGTDAVPDWGEDHVLRTSVWMGQSEQLDLNMDRAVAGRPVVKYVLHAEVDSQYPYYQLGLSVPETIYLVENAVDDSLLELQDWRILDVSVPEEIFLVIQQYGSEIRAREADSDDSMLASPVYQVINNGRYDAKISIAGFINQNTAAGISTHTAMNLVASPADAMSESASMQDLYLAITGTDEGDSFSSMPETSLYDFGTDGVKKQEMGTLEAGEEAYFKFVAAASRRFINHYRDSAFPFSGASATGEARIEHIRNKNQVTGVTSANNARAKYRMTYRIEIVPVRR